MKLRKFLLVTTNLVTISAVTAVSCAAPQPQKRQLTIQNVSSITVTQTSAQFTTKITGLQGTDQLNVKINDTTHNFTVSSLNKPADNEYKITISGLTKGTTYLLDTIKVNNDTLFNVKRPFTTLNDVVTINPPTENREQEEPVNPNPPREENEPSNPGTSNSEPKDPVSENPSTPGGDNNQNPGNTIPNPPNDSDQPGQDPAPKDPTTVPGNGNGIQEPPKQDNTPSNPGANDSATKEPVTEDPKTVTKHPEGEKPNTGNDNVSNGTDNLEKADEQETISPKDGDTDEQPKSEEPIPPRNSAIGGQDSTKTEGDDSKNSENDGTTDSNVQDSQQQDAQNPGSGASTEGTTTTPGTENNGTSGNSETTKRESTSTAQGSSDAGSTSETPPAQERKFDSVTIKVDSTADSYVLFEIVSDKSMYDKEVRGRWWTAYIIKGYEGSNSEVYKDKANAWAPNHTDKKISEQNGKVTFQLSTTTPWTAGRNDFSGTFTLIGLYKDPDNHNFLNKPLTFKTSKGKVEMITQ